MKNNNQSDTLRLVYITTKDRAQALSIGRELVERRLVACVNVLDGMESIYRWQGKIESAKEAILIAKTDATQVNAVSKAVSELHSYEVPCVVALPILAGHQDYLAWLKDQIA